MRKFLLLVCFVSTKMLTASPVITDIPGIRVGHYTDKSAQRGTTVVRFSKEGAIATVDVRGSAPGTRETDLLRTDNGYNENRVHAILLTGGSAFGLGAASGVMRCLEEERIGVNVIKDIIVPIVPGAVIFDLEIGKAKVRPTADWGYKACKSARADSLAVGNIGAGAGASVGKVLGMGSAMKAGIGSYAMKLEGGVWVGAIVVVNAMGDIWDFRNQKIVAGTRGGKKGEFLDSAKLLLENKASSLFFGTNTTIGVVVTNAPYTKTELRKMAQISHNGLARSIRPVHTMYDGDTIFAASLNDKNIKVKPDISTIGLAADEVVGKAILNAAYSATSLSKLPASRDWSRAR